jgi:hypothetical protein
MVARYRAGAVRDAAAVPNQEKLAVETDPQRQKSARFVATELLHIYGSIAPCPSSGSCAILSDERW